MEAKAGTIEDSLFIFFNPINESTVDGCHIIT